MKGFLAVDADGKTVRGLTFYEQGETPGLGGEVEADWWKTLWSDPKFPKKIYDPDGNVAIQVIKGRAEKTDPYAIDGLSGATITSRGVTNIVRFWFGPEGFKPFLDGRAGAYANRTSSPQSNEEAE